MSHAWRTAPLAAQNDEPRAAHCIADARAKSFGVGVLLRMPAVPPTRNPAPPVGMCQSFSELISEPCAAMNGVFSPLQCSYHVSPFHIELGDGLDLPENAPTLRAGSRTARSGSSAGLLLLAADVDIFTESDVWTGRPCESSNDGRQKSIASALSLHHLDLVGLNDFCGARGHSRVKSRRPHPRR